MGNLCSCIDPIGQRLREEDEQQRRYQAQLQQQGAPQVSQLSPRSTFARSHRLATPVVRHPSHRALARRCWRVVDATQTPLPMPMHAAG